MAGSSPKSEQGRPTDPVAGHLPGYEYAMFVAKGRLAQAPEPDCPDEREPEGIRGYDGRFDFGAAGWACSAEARRVSNPETPWNVMKRGLAGDNLWVVEATSTGRPE
jgi:hypothetical protein